MKNEVNEWQLSQEKLLLYFQYQQSQENFNTAPHALNIFQDANFLPT